MRRLTMMLLSSVVVLALLPDAASARSLTVRTDPNDTPGAPDIRKVWSDASRAAVSIKIGTWGRLRSSRHRFSVLLDTRGSYDFDRIIEISGGECIVEKVDDGFLGDFVGGRHARRPSSRTLACRLPREWFGITRTVRFVVLTGVAGESIRTVRRTIDAS
jgi:hypothetical protein